MRVAEGANFTIDHEDDVAVCRLFKRPDLDPPALAALARELVTHARRLSLADGITGMVVDLRRSPSALSPEVETQYAELVSVWEATAQRVAFLVLPDSLQRSQLGRIVTASGGRFASVCLDRNEARSFASDGTVRGEGDPRSLSYVHNRPSRAR